jgi:hypothetical protein
VSLNLRNISAKQFARTRASPARTQLSPMPSNVVDALPEADFYDLLAYLLQQRGQK